MRGALLVEIVERPCPGVQRLDPARRNGIRYQVEHLVGRRDCGTGFERDPGEADARADDDERTAQKGGKTMHTGTAPPEPVTILMLSSMSCRRPSRINFAVVSLMTPAFTWDATYASVFAWYSRRFVSSSRSVKNCRSVAPRSQHLHPAPRIAAACAASFSTFSTKSRCGRRYKHLRQASTSRYAEGMDPLAPFSLKTRAWFERAFAAPTPAQALGWPAIASGEHVLIQAPTGSGKTLAAFLYGDRPARPRRRARGCACSTSRR